MSTPRLPFLYPQLMRTTARLGETSARRCRTARRPTPAPPLPAPATPHHRACPFGTSTASSKPTFAPRVGKGVEPPTPPGGVPAAPPGLAARVRDAPDAPPDAPPSAREQAARALDPQQQQQQQQEQQTALSSPGVTSDAEPEEAKTAAAEDAASSVPGTAAATAAASSEDSSAAPAKKQQQQQQRGAGPMDAVLHRAAAAAAAAAAAPPPPPPPPPGEAPLRPPPYAHHFDSYSLVKQLEGGGYTNAQAITAMKAVRALLAQHLAAAQRGLISRSDVENETYLFRAACAELSAEVRNSRRAADEALRQQRTLLQHEVDNTTQVLNQALLTLHDNVRGMFNDRKMAVREEQKAAESAIQQIFYKIAVTLNSDSRSEIEGMRWVVARRAVIGLVFMVAVSLATLRYSSYVSHASEKQAQSKKKEHEALRKSGGTVDGAIGPDAAEILAAN